MSFKKAITICKYDYSFIILDKEIPAHTSPPGIRINPPKNKIVFHGGPTGSENPIPRLIQPDIETIIPKII